MHVVRSIFKAEPILAYGVLLGAVLAVQDIVGGVPVRDVLPLVLGPVLVFLRAKVSPAE